MRITSAPLAAISALLVLGGCASTRSRLDLGPSSSQHLKPNIADESRSVPNSYAPDVEWREYANAMIDPVPIRGDSVRQFEEIPARDRQALTRYMELHFRTARAERFSIVNASMPRTVPVRATLTAGKAKSTGGALDAAKAEIENAAESPVAQLP
ncbi:DUF3313 family protein [Variovorax sp. RT4R15]|uniref:DUF3313 family protein n=1 Tax=Variovorax sp. RT4R15 TaxID=3443737 RepID=UPI003F45A850